MKVIVHDLGKEYNEILQKKCDVMIHADGKYAPCHGHCRHSRRAYTLPVKHRFVFS